jgi:4-hydroxybenzoate polyprenyltransferase
MNSHDLKTISEPNTFFYKWNTYQKERFPVVLHGILIAAFSSSAVSFSALVSGRSWPAFSAYLVAFLTCFTFFLQLRIADEFKDFEEDKQFRSYRPVPRGLIKLSELRNLFILGGIIQLGAAWLYNPKLIVLLLVTWVYLTLMSREFFIHAWLKAHPVTYMWSHMVIMPMIDFYATSTDWIVYGKPALALYWFVALSFFNGMNLELGRKIRAPEDEEQGVETYSFLWGRKKAIVTWLGMLAATGLCGIGASSHLPHPFYAIITTFVVAWWLLSMGCSLYFISHLKKGAGKIFELCSGLFTLFIYLLLGLIPMFVKG